MNEQNSSTLVVALALLLTAVRILDPISSEWLALGLILIAGIPHGSFDLRFAEKRWGHSMRARTLVIACYLASGALMSTACLIWPTFGLAVFLLISVVHFAEGERVYSTSEIPWVIGIAAILLPIALHPLEAAPYLSFFIADDSFASLHAPLTAIGYGVALLIVSLLVLEATSERLHTTIQLAVCLASWIVLPPLSGFCVWFIGRHSRQHMQRAVPFLGEGLRKLPRDFVIISVLAVALIIPLNFWFDLRDLHQLFAASIVLIAGLTLPHMIITHAVEEKSARSASR